MAEPSAVYQGSTPAIENGGLNALQLALANYMAINNPSPFGINPAFQESMKTFSDPGELSPFDVDTRTGFPRTPDLLYNVSEGIAYIARGEDIYLLRRAQDCGPDENRTEEVYLGQRPDVAAGTWAFYGMIRRGTVSGGSFGDSGIGGYVDSQGYAIGGYDFGLGYGFGEGFDGFGNHGDIGSSTNGSGFGLGGDLDSATGKYICTAMCKTYGFGEFRTKIWLAWSRKHLNDYHQIGYHTLFLPMVNYAYYSGKDSIGKKAVRTTLEFLMRHRTADLRARLRGGEVKRDTIGRIWNAIFEPLIYITGRIKGRK